MTKKKLPANHPQRKTPKRKPRAPKIVGTPSNPSYTHAANLTRTPNSWTYQYSRLHERRDDAPKPAPYAPSTPYFADVCGVPYSRTDEYPACWEDDLTIVRPAPWRVWVSRKLTALARWVAP